MVSVMGDLEAAMVQVLVVCGLRVKGQFVSYQLKI
jgi:hypothetical protein